VQVGLATTSSTHREQPGLTLKTTVSYNHFIVLQKPLRLRVDLHLGLNGIIVRCRCESVVYHPDPFLIIDDADHVEAIESFATIVSSSRFSRSSRSTIQHHVDAVYEAYAVGYAELGEDPVLDLCALLRLGPEDRFSSETLDRFGSIVGPLDYSAV
jgi:hypothetical protein